MRGGTGARPRRRWKNDFVTFTFFILVTFLRLLTFFFKFERFLL